MLLVKDGKQEVVESTFLDIWESLVDKSLLQEEVDQGGLIMRVPQLSQAFEDASDAQVVVSVPVNEGESWAKLITGFLVFVVLNTIAHLLRFANLLAQFGARLTSPVSLLSSSIP